MLNSHSLIGHIGKEPDTRYTPAGVCVLNFTVATNESDKQPDGSYSDVTEWHRVRFVGKSAEYASKKLKSGSLVYVEGAQRTEIWTDRQKQDHKVHYIKAIKVKPLAKLKDKPQTTGTTAAQYSDPDPMQQHWDIDSKPY